MRKIFPHLLPGLALTGMAVLGLTAQAAAAPVTRVEVTVRDSGRQASPRLLERMASSMQVVAEQLFNGKDSSLVEEERDDYRRLLAEISDRVITGYQTGDVALTAVDGAQGATARIAFTVSPWGGVVRDAAVDLQFSGISPETAPLLEQRLPGLRREIRQTLRGASLDAADWATGILRARIREQVRQALPEFKAAVDLVTRNDVAVVQVIIYPVGQVVQDVEYSMVSHSIPNILLMKLKYSYSEKAKAIRGLPVAYVARNRKLLEQKLLRELEREPRVRRHHLRPGVTIVPGPDTRVDITLESDEYVIWFEGYGDIGRDDHNLSGKAHFGKMISRQDEVFGEIGLDLKDVEWQFSPGYTWHNGKLALSWRRIFPEAENGWKAEYKFAPRWRVRAERFGDRHENEYALRYRIHEFLSGEYVYSTNKSYFRVIGNL